MNTAIPPNWVTGRCASRNITLIRQRALISRGIGLSAAFDCIVLLSQILGSKLRPNFGFQVNQCFANRRGRFAKTHFPTCRMRNRGSRNTATIYSAKSYPLAPCCFPNGSMPYFLLDTHFHGFGVRKLGRADQALIFADQRSKRERLRCAEG
jgi:hypothetical protein